jgi:hypothetical protein
MWVIVRLFLENKNAVGSDDSKQILVLCTGMEESKQNTWV